MHILLMEVLSRYSKQQNVSDRLCKALEYALTVSFDALPKPTEPPPKIHKLRDRLPLETVEALIEDYRAGLKGAALAEKYGIQKNSVLGLLKQHGVDTHRPTVTNEQCKKAVELLQSGLALGKVSSELALAYTTLARALSSRGLPTRKTWS
jgi:hypothetical protein